MLELKEDCFAYAGTECNCLKELQCKNCNFYKEKSKVDLEEIEKTIAIYNATHNN